MVFKENKRSVRVTFLMNKDEAQCVENYLRKYKIVNKSRWMRETLISSIIRNLEKDYPTLFDESDMRR